jgi:hypothetical protein
MPHLTFSAIMELTMDGHVNCETRHYGQHRRERACDNVSKAIRRLLDMARSVGADNIG